MTKNDHIQLQSLFFWLNKFTLHMYFDGVRSMVFLIIDKLILPRVCSLMLLPLRKLDLHLTDFEKKWSESSEGICSQAKMLISNTNIAPHSHYGSCS